jgi:hypothetical protein
MGTIIIKDTNISFVKKLLSGYLIAGAGISLVLYLYNYGFLGILSTLLPSLLVLVILLFFIYSGYKGLVSDSNYSFIHAQISFLIQSIYFSILGFEFENFFGPYVSIGFTDTPEFKIIYAFKLIWFHFLNGYKPESAAISFSINLVPIFFLYLVSLKNKKSKQLSNQEDLLENI